MSLYRFIKLIAKFANQNVESHVKDIIKIIDNQTIFYYFFLILILLQCHQHILAVRKRILLKSWLERNINQKN